MLFPFPGPNIGTHHTEPKSHPISEWLFDMLILRLRSHAPLPIHLIKGTTNHLCNAVFNEARTSIDVKNRYTLIGTKKSAVYHMNLFVTIPNSMKSMSAMSAASLTAA